MSEKEKARVKLITQILENTTAYECNQFAYEVDEDTVRVWSLGKSGEPDNIFFPIELVTALHPIARGYMEYNKKEARVEFITY